MNILIIGAGKFGRALGKILGDNGHALNYYDPMVFPERSVMEAGASAEVVILALPSMAIMEFLATYPTELRNLPTVLTSKGLTNLDLFRDFAHLMVLSGPAFAEDLMAGVPATLTASDPLVRDLFQNEQMTIELTNDTLGVVLCGTLKNAFAVGAGYWYGERDIEDFLAEALIEEGDYLMDHGARPETAQLACGQGDLRLTCTSPKSRNWQCGQLLKSGATLDEVVEKLGTIEGLNILKRLDYVNYALLAEIRDLIP